jgi:branched-chain amino acid transport system substrate-binding protein
MSGPTYEDQFDILLQNIAAEGGTTVAFIYSNTEFGRDPIEAGKKKAEELGIKVVLEEATKAQGADIPTHITKLAQSGAEYCILHGYVTGVWPQLIGGARQFGLPVKFKGTFWGMEKLIADRITKEAGPFLQGYQGVMPYRYFWDREGAPRYQKYAELAKAMFAGTPLENYMSTWTLQAMCGLELAMKAYRDTAEKGLELTPDNTAESLSAISDWDSGGFFGGPVSMVNNKIGTGRVYEYSAETNLFSPVSDWLNT